MTDLESNKAARLSRIGGGLYLIIIVLGVFEAAFIRERIVVSGDVVETAARLRSMQSLWRAGIASDFIVLCCSVPLAMIFYVLLRPVSQILAGIAIFFNLMCIAVEAASNLTLVVAMLPQGNASYLASFTDGQRQAISALAIRTYNYGFGAALIFFGVECVLLGVLIVRSGYLPKAVGVLMQVAGGCYLVNSFAVILLPTLAARLFPAILLPALVGESSLCLWLLFKGIDCRRWNERTVLDARAPASANLLI